MVSTSTVFLPAHGLNGWLIVHELYFYAKFNWNRAWNEYKMGFGTPGSNYWFGLEKLHQMTSVSTYRVRIEIHRIPQDVVLWLEMNVFYVASESQYYQLMWNGMSGDLALTTVLPADPVTYHTGMVFSTYDCNHNLVATYDCPNLQGGGWWFHNCYSVCLTCILNSYGCSSSTTEYNAAGGTVCSDHTRMMIRPA
jgi:ficolin